MTSRARPIPRQLARSPFHISAGLAAGLTPSRLRARDLSAPFAGVRTARTPAETVFELMREYRPRMAAGEFFSHATAALAHGMWLPLALEERIEVHVSVHKPDRAPRDRRVRGHHLIPRPGLVTLWRGIRVAGAVETWCQLGTVLGLEDLVVAGDSLVARGRPDADRVLVELRAASSDEHRPNAKLLAEAASMIRPGHRSPGESRVRQVLLQAGLPEFEINEDVFDADGDWVAEVDLVHRGRRIALEYEGDGHRTDQRQFRKDINRYERLQDIDWRVVRVTGDDLTSRRAELVARVGRLLGL